MPEIDPLFIDAVDGHIEDKDQRAEWDDDEMRAALLEARKGDTLQEAVEGRDLTDGQVSNAMDHVEERFEQLTARRNSGSGLFNDPLEDAVESFRDFFDTLNAKYEMGVSDVAVQMMVDEIRDAGQLPRPGYVHNFLDSANSGVSNSNDLNYIRRRYDQWLQNQQKEMGSGGGMSMGGGFGGASVGDGGQGLPQQGSGVAVPDGNSVFPGQQQQDDSGGDDRIDRLEQKVAELTEVLKEDDEDDDDEQMVTIEKENGTKLTVPVSHPAAQEAFRDDGGSDSPDFMEMLQQAKEAGLVVGPQQLQQMQSDDGGIEETVEKLQSLGLLDNEEEQALAQSVQQAISEMGQKQVQAQQQIGQQFASVLEEITDDEEEEDEDLTAEQVEEIIDTKLTKSETERLREEMDEKFEQVMSEVSKSRRNRSDGTQDPDYLKTDRKMEYQEKQLDTVNENLRELPSAVAESVRDGLVPALQELRHMSGEGSNPLFTPPGEGGRGQPEYTPQEAVERRERQNGDPGGYRDETDTEESGFPDQDTDPEPEREANGEMAVDVPRGVSEDDAAEVRARLGLDSDDSQPEADA